jgi:hypothetical protein
VELEPAVTDAGENVAPAPLGKPDTARLTVPATPAVTAVEIVLLPLEFCPRVSVEGDALMLKSLV